MLYQIESVTGRVYDLKYDQTVERTVHSCTNDLPFYREVAEQSPDFVRIDNITIGENNIVTFDHTLKDFYMNLDSLEELNERIYKPVCEQRRFEVYFQKPYLMVDPESHAIVIHDDYVE